MMQKNTVASKDFKANNIFFQHKLDKRFRRYIVVVNIDNKEFYYQGGWSKKDKKGQENRHFLTNNYSQAHLYISEDAAKKRLEKLLENNHLNLSVENCSCREVFGDFDGVLFGDQENFDYSAIVDLASKRVIVYRGINHIEIPVRYVLIQWLCQIKLISDENYLDVIDYTGLEDNHYSQNIYKEAIKDIKLYPKLRTFMKLSKTMFEDGRTWGILPSLYEKCDNYIRKSIIPLPPAQIVDNDIDKQFIIDEYRELGDYLLDKEEQPSIKFKERAAGFRKNIGKIKRPRKSKNKQIKKA